MSWNWMLKSMNKKKDVQNSFADYHEISRQLSTQMQEPEWFSTYRQQAFDRLEELAPPKIERLNYSDWNVWAIPEIENNYSKNPFHFSSKNKEVLIGDFKEAYLKDKALFKACYEQSGFMEMDDLFQAYTMAFLTDSLFVYIPKNCQVDTPVELAFQSENKVTNRQVLIYAAANSSVKIIDKYQSEDSKEAKTANIHIQVVVENGANVHYSSLDQLHKNTTGYIRRAAKVQRDAEVNWALGSMNDGDVIEDVQVLLQGQGSTSDVKTVAISSGEQTQAVNVDVTNSGSNTVGHIFQHGVALDQSTLTFNGIGRIEKNAKNSDAQQESRILMLSDEARADANPILLIDEYEVTAGHAASISRVDQEQLYYLMSRGLEEKQAEKLVIRGFLGIVLAEISMPEVRQELTHTIERKLAQYGNELA